MAKKKYRRPKWRFLVILALIALLAYLGYLAYPYGYTLLKGQPYLNPYAETRENETYQLELWVKLPSIANTMPLREALEQSITEFSATRPNFVVNITYLPASQAMERLELALQAGMPPDLFFHADNSQAYFGELQIPLEIYLSPEVRALWPEAVWRQASVDEKVYALPVAFFPRVMLVNNSLWQPTGCQQTQVAANGWTWEQFLQCISETRGSQVYGYVPTSIGDAFFSCMIAAWEQPAALRYDGSIAWTREQLCSIAEAWEQLSKSQAVPTPASAMDNDCLHLFLSGKAACIGPLNHNLARWLWEQAQDSGIQPALLPMFSHNGNSDLRGIFLAAFRQATYQGQRHTKACAELAIWLTPELAKHMGRFTGAVPAQSHLVANLDLPFDQASSAVYTDLARTLPVAYGYGPAPGLSETHWEHTIAPAWNAFVNKQSSAEQFAEMVLAGLARATIAGP